MFARAETLRGVTGAAALDDRLARLRNGMAGS
jgi:hypothetical protein